MQKTQQPTFFPLRENCRCFTQNSYVPTCIRTVHFLHRYFCKVIFSSGPEGTDVSIHTQQVCYHLLIIKPHCTAATQFKSKTNQTAPHYAITLLLMDP